MKYTPYLFLTFLSFIALKALFFSPYLPLFHDQVQAERVYELTKSLSYGQFPVRYVSDLGYGFGYPIFNYYAPFPYYLGSLFFLLGINLIVSTKIAIALPFLLSGFSMYIFAKNYWGRAGATLSSVLYLLAPYHGVQLYVRGSVGEIYTYALLPLICFGLASLWEEKLNRKKVAMGIIALTLLCLSHTLGVYMTALLLMIYFLSGVVYLFLKNKDFLILWLVRNFIFVFIAFSLSAFFILPAFFELRYTNFSLQSGNDVNFHDHFLSLSQLWSSPWGFGGSAPGYDQDGMSFMVGKMTIVLSLLSIVLALVFSRKITSTRVLSGLTVFLLLALLAVFLTLSSSQFLWEIVPYIKIVQFPWRFLIFINLFLCLISGSIVIYLRAFLSKRNFQIVYILSLVLLTLTLLFSSTDFLFKTKYFEANGYYKLSAKDLIDQKHLRFEASKISDEYLPQGGQRASTLSDISTDTVSCMALCAVKNVNIEPTIYSFSVAIEKNANVYVDKLNFPGFIVTVDGKQSKVLSGPGNILGVEVPQGRHNIIFSLSNTWIRSVSNLISLLAFIIVIMYPLRRNLWKLNQKQR